jgi:hypothetical protein
LEEILRRIFFTAFYKRDEYDGWDREEAICEWNRRSPFRFSRLERMSTLRSDYCGN